MKTLRTIPTLIIFLFASYVFPSDEKFDSLITVGINQIYDIKFEQAQETFSAVRELYPQHPSGYFFDTMILWWKILLDINNEEFDDEFIDKIEEVIDFCDNILDENPADIDALFFKGGALGFRGRLYAYRKSWFNAALDGKDALPIVHNAYASDPTNPDIQLGFGIYNYYAAVVPQKYPAVKPFMILFPEGNKTEGLKQLKYVAENGKYAKIESRYFLATSYYSFESNYRKALEQISVLTDLYPDNPRFKSLLGRIWVKKNDYHNASQVFKEVIKKSKQDLPGFNKRAVREASYYIAVNYEKQNNTDSSMYYFKLCESISKEIDKDEESGFLINSGIYIAKFYELQNEINKAIRKFEEILDYREYKDSHDRAERAIERLTALIDN